MTLARLKTRLEEAKKAAYAADREANHAVINAAVIEDAVDRAGPDLSAGLYAVYGNACTRRMRTVKAATKAAKAVDDAQWSVDMVAAREMTRCSMTEEIYVSCS